MFNKLVEELAVCGFNAVRAIAEHHPETINRFFLTEERLPLFTDLCKNLADRKRPYKICESEELEKVCKSSHHQGVAVMISVPESVPLGMEDLDLWCNESKTGVVLHSVGNDHNLGAIVRSAAFFDAHFVVISELDDYARLTTAAYRVAEGGFEHVCVRQVKRTVSFLRDAAKKLIVIGTDPRARLRIRDLPSVLGKKNGVNGKRKGIVLVVGNEEKGLPEEIKDCCTALMRVPGTGNIESLNVAQAATLFLHEIYES
ncbi:MAG: RNA methyltransferase [Spirochaetaceae bacterium]|jgi:TrmH RNA methyltransferase|nr:RNA methyltransferase [Spirochaetaceae bacterium]